MGGKEKVTITVLKVALQCEKCYRKVKKALCKFPQIRDQTYDEKNNQVIIKGGGAIKSIGIKEPEKPKPPAGEPKPTPPQKKPSQPPETAKPPPLQDKKKNPPPSTQPDDDDVKKPDTTETVKKPAKALEPMKSALTTAFVPAYPAYPPAPVNAGCMDYYGGHPSSYSVTRPDYFSEENPQACVIM